MKRCGNTTIPAPQFARWPRPPPPAFTHANAPRVHCLRGAHRLLPCPLFIFLFIFPNFKIHFLSFFLSLFSRRFDNNVERAADYLFSDPAPPSAAPLPTARAVATPPAPSGGGNVDIPEHFLCGITYVSFSDGGGHYSRSSYAVDFLVLYLSLCFSQHLSAHGPTFAVKHL